MSAERFGARGEVCAPIKTVSWMPHPHILYARIDTTLAGFAVANFAQVSIRLRRRSEQVASEVGRRRRDALDQRMAGAWCQRDQEGPIARRVATAVGERSWGHLWGQL